MSHKKCPQCKDRILSKKHKYEYHTQTVDIQLKKGMQILGFYIMRAKLFNRDYHLR